VRLWRLTKPQYAPGLDGEGARLAGGRWNSPGLPMVYCSSSRALAALEILVHLPAAMRRKDALPPLVAVALDLPDALIEDSGQFTAPNDGVGRVMGDTWLRSGSSVGLIVPSRVIQRERNIVLNPRHPRMSEVNVILTETFVFDDRLAY
jgi:RES domain-containing protein